MKTALAFVFGLALTLWGGAIMMKPSRVTVHSISYWLIVRMHFGWIDVQQKAAERPLTRRQVRLHGTLALIVGLGMLLAALVFTLEL